ncbi:Uma2 family endonuclease [Fibrella aquatilis]|uniref:Uma2 family endonuclease n=1 Tax=Fibrella aquatilis TaxID=2817059 RepID=A0A939G681_9BACT|nr:Uma2 family endonuclease [Fibrella aquatilis]MBO0932914.1 Uma2 family endonuclease [Fibrella aquatilis]
MTTTAPALLPLTLAERALAPDVLHVKATFEEYLDFAEQCEYNVEYVNGEILSMSQASLPHESLVSRLSTIFNILFDEDDTIMVCASSIKIHVAATGDSFNADVSIIRGEPYYLRLPSGQLSTVEITNPILVVEILSKSTQAFDLSDKLEAYKQIPSLEQVLFVSQEQPWVSAFVRSETPGVWLNTSAHSLTDSIGVLTHDVSLAEVYKKMKFA